MRLGQFNERHDPMIKAALKDLDNLIALAFDASGNPEIANALDPIKESAVKIKKLKENIQNHHNSKNTNQHFLSSLPNGFV